MMILASYRAGYHRGKEGEYLLFYLNVYGSNNKCKRLFQGLYDIASYYFGPGNWHSEAPEYLQLLLYHQASLCESFLEGLQSNQNSPGQFFANFLSTGLGVSCQFLPAS